MPTYATLDYLPDLSRLAMINAVGLNFLPYTPSLSGITWDNSAFSIATSIGANSTFRWTGTAGATYDFFSTSYYDPTGIRVYDSLGNAVATDTESITDPAGSDKLFNFVAPYSGTYYVTAGWGQSALSPVATVSAYEDIDTATGTATDDYAGNTSTSGTVAIGGLSTGNIEVAGDKDWFRVSLLAGTTYTFDLRGVQGNGGTLGSGNLHSPYLSLYDSLGLYRTASYTNGGGDPLLRFTPSSSGTYYLGVDELFGTGTGTYTLRASALTVTDDYSANILTLGSLSVGGQSTGNIETAGDKDWFGVSLQAGTTYTFELRGADGSGGTLGNGFAEAYLSLYDTSGLYRTATANGGNGGDPLISFTPSTTGTYFLGVQELFGTSTGTYTLRASVATVSTDDYKNDTTTTGTLSPGGSVSGSIEIGGDADWFGITLTAGTSYTFNLDAAASAGLTDPYLRFYNSSGILLNSDDDSGAGLNAQLSYTPAVTGRYFLGSSSASFFSTQTGRYNLSVNSGNTIVDDYAANVLTTGTITPGARVSGRIETVSDNDWFSVRLTAGTTYAIQLDSTGPAPLSDPYLRLYDITGVRLNSDDDSGAGLNALLNFTPINTGTYYLGASASGIYGTSTGNYTLSVAPVAVTPDDYAANTNTTGQANVGATLSGQIEASGDHDWFSVTLTAGTRYTINLNGAANTGLYDPYTRLYSSSGTLLASDDDSGSGLNAELSYTPTTSGTYYIDASSASFFSSTTGNYTLTVNAAAPVVDDYMAATSTTGRATVGGKVTGKIETSGDHDWFSITLTAGNTYTINLNATASTGLGDPYIRLRNSAGAQVAYDDDSGVGLNSQLTYTPTTTDTYYIDASSSTLLSSLTGNYELSVSAATSAPVPVTATGFNIDVRYTGDAQYQAAFNNAALRWQSIITSDLPDVTNWQYGLIDDLLITASVAAIDGPGGVLARAAPTALRSESGLPYLGMMQFDSADMARVLANGTLEGLIVHEMGHVLGIGCLWDNQDLLDPINNSQYIGTYGLSAWRTVSGNANASYVPLETAGGRGTAGVHWSENTFGDELMTGYVDNTMPISIVTIGTLADLGYTVNYAQADAYTFA